MLLQADRLPLWGRLGRDGMQVAKVARVVECKSHQTGWNEQRQTEARTIYQPTAAWISCISEAKALEERRPLGAGELPC